VLDGCPTVHLWKCANTTKHTKITKDDGKGNFFFVGFVPFVVKITLYIRLPSPCS